MANNEQRQDWPEGKSKTADEPPVSMRDYRAHKIGIAVLEAVEATSREIAREEVELANDSTSEVGEQDPAPSEGSEGEGEPVAYCADGLLGSLRLVDARQRPREEYWRPLYSHETVQRLQREKLAEVERVSDKLQEVSQENDRLQAELASSSTSAVGEQEREAHTASALASLVHRLDHQAKVIADLRERIRERQTWDIDKVLAQHSPSPDPDSTEADDGTG